MILDYKNHIISAWRKKHKAEIRAYCAMPNHVHMIAVPETEEGLLLEMVHNWLGFLSHAEERRAKEMSMVSPELESQK